MCVRVFVHVCVRVCVCGLREWYVCCVGVGIMCVHVHACVLVPYMQCE